MLTTPKLLESTRIAGGLKGAFLKRFIDESLDARHHRMLRIDERAVEA